MTIKREKPKLKRYPNRFNRTVDRNLTTNDKEDTVKASVSLKSEKGDSWLNEQSFLTDSDLEEVTNIKLNCDKYLKNLIF